MYMCALYFSKVNRSNIYKQDKTTSWHILNYFNVILKAFFSQDNKISFWCTPIQIQSAPTFQLASMHFILSLTLISQCGFDIVKVDMQLSQWLSWRLHKSAYPIRLSCNNKINIFIFAGLGIHKHSARLGGRSFDLKYLMSQMQNFQSNEI